MIKHNKITKTIQLKFNNTSINYFKILAKIIIAYKLY